MYARKSNIALNKLEVTVEAERLEDSPKLSGVTIKVKVLANARRELIEAAWRRTEANCPVLLIYREPIPVKLSSKSFRLTTTKVSF